MLYFSGSKIKLTTQDIKLFSESLIAVYPPTASKTVKTVQSKCDSVRRVLGQTPAANFHLMEEILG